MVKFVLFVRKDQKINEKEAEDGQFLTLSYKNSGQLFYRTQDDVLNKNFETHFVPVCSRFSTA